MTLGDDKPSPAPITLITGGSRGIGKALAEEFSKGGFDVLLIARSEEPLKKTAQDLKQRYDNKVFIRVADLGLSEDCAKLKPYLKSQNLYCQYLVNNAGMGLAGDFAQLDEQALRDMLDLNIRALTDLSRRFLPDMLRRGEGGILNIASLGGYLPGPFQAAYYASKAYVISFTQALKWEVWGSGVHICIMAPGPVRTRFHRLMGARSEFYINAGAGISAKKAARMGYSGLICGKSLIIPGILSQIGVIALKIIPHDLLLPFMGWFLKPRYKNDEER